MIVVKYERGNGYHCGCCRRTDTDVIFGATKEEVVNEFTEEAIYAEGDIYIEELEGVDDKKEFHDYLTNAGETAWKKYENERFIQREVRELRVIEKWLKDGVNEEIERKTKNMNERIQKLKESYDYTYSEEA